MKFVLTMDLDNAAFEGFCDGQRDGIAVRQTLRSMIERIDTPLTVGDGAGIRDVNGNTVGEWEIVDDA